MTSLGRDGVFEVRGLDPIQHWRRTAPIQWISPGYLAESAVVVVVAVVAAAATPGTLPCSARCFGSS